jgi:hypothetical protein
MVCALAVVIETGTLSQAALLKVKKMASLPDGITGENGEVAVVTADSEVQTRLNFTTCWEAIQEIFEKLRTRGGGAGRTLDGVDAAIALLASRSRWNYHKLTVSVKSYPDANVRARPGYWSGVRDAAN